MSVPPNPVSSSCMPRCLLMARAAFSTMITASTWPARRAAVASVAVVKARRPTGFRPRFTMSSFASLDLRSW